jgi:uncharacterized membrane protein YeaQ/YmgE (transglycosylase-associated protein family)
MSIIAWMILGLFAGAIAKAIYPGRQGGGFIATMFLGIVGALIGGSFVRFLETGTFRLISPTRLSIASLIYAVLGALVAIFILSLANGRRAT